MDRRRRYNRVGVSPAVQSGGIVRKRGCEGAKGEDTGDERPEGWGVVPDESQSSPRRASGWPTPRFRLADNADAICRGANAENAGPRVFFFPPSIFFLIR